MPIIFWVVDIVVTALEIYKWIVLAAIVLSWLEAFGVINRYNPFVNQVGYALRRLTEPVLQPIRRVMPDLGGLDLSPVVLFFLIYAIQSFLVRVLLPSAF